VTGTIGWRASSGEVLSREWDGEMVLYDERTGATHCLDSFATHVLHHVQRRSMSEAQLAAELGLADPEALAQLAAMIEQLAQLKLIEVD
jgi:PqqD family protein of HPr-rel-A system